jgi:hypothetical protein
VVQRNFQQHQLDYNHDEGLYEKGGVEFRPRVVEHSAESLVSAIRSTWSGEVSLPQYRCDQHNQWDIQRKARAGLRPVYRIRLVGIGSYGGDYDEYWSNEARYEGHDAHGGGRDGGRGIFEKGGDFGSIKIPSMKTYYMYRKSNWNWG